MSISKLTGHLMSQALLGALFFVLAGCGYIPGSAVQIKPEANAFSVLSQLRQISKDLGYEEDADKSYRVSYKNNQDETVRIVTIFHNKEWPNISLSIALNENNKQFVIVISDEPSFIFGSGDPMLKGIPRQKYEELVKVLKEHFGDSRVIESEE